MVAKINTPTKKSVTTKKYSEFLTGGRRFSDGGERERGPVHAVCVLSHQTAELGVRGVRIHELIRPEADGLGEGVIHAGVPVDDDHDVHDEVGDSEDVGKVSPCFGALEKLEQAVDPQ